MLFDFCNADIGTRIHCPSVVSVDNYEITNLLYSSSSSASNNGTTTGRTGFLGERFVRPPVDIFVTFPFTIDIYEIWVKPRLQRGEYDSKAIMGISVSVSSTTTTITTTEREERQQQQPAPRMSHRNTAARSNTINNDHHKFYFCGKFFDLQKESGYVILRNPNFREKTVKPSSGRAPASGKIEENKAGPVPCGTAPPSSSTGGGGASGGRSNSEGANGPTSRTESKTVANSTTVIVMRKNNAQYLNCVRVLKITIMKGVDSSVCIGGLKVIGQPSASVLNGDKFVQEEFKCFTEYCSQNCNNINIFINHQENHSSPVSFQKVDLFSQLRGGSAALGPVAGAPKDAGPYNSSNRTLMNEQHDQRVIPSEYLDPLTHAIMRDPVVTPSGVVIDYSTLLQHFKYRQTDPFTNRKMSLSDVTQHIQLKDRINRFILEGRAGGGGTTTTTTTTATAAAEASPGGTESINHKGHAVAVAVAPPSSPPAVPLGSNMTTHNTSTDDQQRAPRYRTIERRRPIISAPTATATATTTTTTAASTHRAAFKPFSGTGKRLREETNTSDPYKTQESSPRGATTTTTTTTTTTGWVRLQPDQRAQKQQRQQQQQQQQHSEVIVLDDSEDDDK